MNTYILHKENISVIVVDDLEFSQKVIRSSLVKSGFNDIRTAGSANDALLMLYAQRAHVVLADFWMPDMNGLEMTDLIRRWDESNDRYTGIILLTAEDTASSIAEAFDRGVDDFVSKSTDPLELAARVFSTGRSAKRQNQLRSRTRAISDQLLQAQQLNLQDPETQLPNRTWLEQHLQALSKYCATRGGGLALGLIEVHSELVKLPPSTLKMVAHSLQLALRPLDMVARLEDNRFAVVIHYQNPEAFNTDLFQRLVSKVRYHTHKTSDEDKQLEISTGIWHADGLAIYPSVEQIITAAQQSSKIVK